MRAVVLSAAALVLAAVLPNAGTAQDYYSDIRPVLVENCVGCHAEEGIGWSMEDPEEAYSRRTRIARAVTNGVMPPWIAEAGHQVYMDDISLDQGVIEMMAAWRDAGFPKGTFRADAAPSTSPLDFVADMSIEVLPGTSYLPAQGMDDDYRCFVVDWKGDEPAYVTGFKAVPGNLNVAHHVVVHAIEPGMVERYKEVDESVEGAGYECFGGALPTSFDWDAYEQQYAGGLDELSQAEWWLTHWAPGMNGHHFPEDTGILMKPGSGLVVQVHYYSKEAKGESDAGTRLEFEVASTVERPAFHLVQTNNDWLASEQNKTMVIPPGEPTTYVVDVSLASWLSDAASMADVDRSRIQGFEVYSANLHMHAHGHSGEIMLSDEDGKTEVLLSVPKWDLDWQRDFVFEQPKTFSLDQLGNTTLRVSCTYLNRTDEIVYGGFGSFDEMCFNFSYVALDLGERNAETRSGGN